MSDERLLTAEQLAQVLQLPRSTVWRLSRSGQIPCFRAGRLMRFDIVEVKAALMARQNGDGVASVT